jgi:hypothetical protein
MWETTTPVEPGRITRVSACLTLSRVGLHKLTGLAALRSNRSLRLGGVGAEKADCLLNFMSAISILYSPRFLRLPEMGRKDLYACQIKTTMPLNDVEAVR